MAFFQTLRVYSKENKDVTSTNWTSSVNAEPGVLTEVFNALSGLPLKDRDCNLVVDDMAIRKQLMLNAKVCKYVGGCGFGNELQLNNSQILATEALIFMLMSLNGKWKWPIGYFLYTRSTAVAQAVLIKTSLKSYAQVAL